MTDNVTSLPKKRGGRERGSKNRVSSNSLSIDARIAIMASYHRLGGIQFLVELGKTEPMVWGMLFGKLFKTQDGGEAQGVTIVVQQLAPSDQPVPGVLNSPIRAHIAPPRLIAQHGAVIDVQANEPHDE